jgi:hypothetical protein
VHAELGQHVLDVRPERVAAHPERARDVDGRLARRDPLKDLELSRGQPFHPLRELAVGPTLHAEARERKLDLADRVEGLPSEGPPDRVGQIGDGLRLANESSGAGLDRSGEDHVVLVSRKEDHPSAGGLALDPPGRLEAVHPGHLDVHEEHIRVLPLCRRDGGLAVGHDLDDGEVVLVVQGDLEGFAEGPVVIGDDHTDILIARPRCLAVLGSRSGSRHRGIVGLPGAGFEYPHRRIFPCPPTEGHQMRGGG